MIRTLLYWNAVNMRWLIVAFLGLFLLFGSGCYIATTYHHAAPRYAIQGHFWTYYPHLHVYRNSDGFFYYWNGAYWEYCLRLPTRFGPLRGGIRMKYRGPRPWNHRERNWHPHRHPHRRH